MQAEGREVRGQRPSTHPLTPRGRLLRGSCNWENTGMLIFCLWPCPHVWLRGTWLYSWHQAHLDPEATPRGAGHTCSYTPLTR